MEKRVTLRDIAKATGVHFTTVGLVLRNDPRVSADTAALVQKAAVRLGYTHDAMLSALSTYRHRDSRRFSGVIAYVVTYSPEDILKNNVTESMLIKSATAHAESHNFKLEIFSLTAPGMTSGRMSKLLRARGVQGVILAPMQPMPGPMNDLDWEYFSPVALGYSITNLKIDRVCFHHASNMRLALGCLRERGHRRVGLVMNREVYERSRGLVLGSYVAEQLIQPVEDQVSPLFLPEVDITKKNLERWIRKERIDSVILTGMPLTIYGLIRELGYEMPGKMGVALISRFGLTDGLAGINENIELLAEAAIESAISLIQHNKRGLPAYPRYTLIEGTWVDRPTVRTLPVTK